MHYAILHKGTTKIFVKHTEEGFFVSSTLSSREPFSVAIRKAMKVVNAIPTRNYNASDIRVVSRDLGYTFEQWSLSPAITAMYKCMNVPP